VTVTRFDDLPSIDAPPAGRGIKPLWRRRSFLRTVFLVATGASVQLVGLLPPARRALASHVGTNGYQIVTGCPQGYSDSCADPCDVSPVCSDCCETSGHNVGYFKNSGVYTLRTNDCYPVTIYDGWTWTHNSGTGCCSGCKNPTFRCHDGRKSGVAKTCKWIITCPCGVGCAC
jgi:hypothetical protein